MHRAVSGKTVLFPATQRHVWPIVPQFWMMSTKGGMPVFPVRLVRVHPDLGFKSLKLPMS